MGNGTDSAEGLHMTSEQPTQEQQEGGRRFPTGWVVFVLIVLVLIGWLTARYLVKRQLLRQLGRADVQARLPAAQKLLDMEVLEDSMAAQPIIVRSKTAEALGEIGSEEAIRVLGTILHDQEEAPRRWARNALIKQGWRAVPVLMAALSAGGGTADETITALVEIGGDNAEKLRLLLSDRSAYGAAASALAQLGGVGVDALVRGCYTVDGDVRGAALSSMADEGIEAAIAPALYNLKPLPNAKTGAAIKALGLLEAREAADEIIPFLTDKANREAAVTALGQIGHPQAVEPILATMTETEKRYRNAAVLALRRIGAPAYPRLVEALDSSEMLLRRAGASALIGSDSPQVTQPLIAALQDMDAEVRASAALALGWEGNVQAVAPLVGKLSDPSWRVVDAAVEALSELGMPAVEPLLARLRAEDTPLAVRYLVARALGTMGSPAVPRLVEALSAADVSLQKWAAVALGHTGDQRAVKPLEKLRDRSDNREVRWVAGEQVRRLTGFAAS